MGDVSDGLAGALDGTLDGTELDERIEVAARTLIDGARRAGVSIACAESLTGGWLAGALVSIPGASDVLHGAVVAYTPAMKEKILGVSGELLAKAGTVDPRVARAMAANVRNLMDAGVALATTGVAGPGPAEGKAAGTAYIAVDSAGSGAVVRRIQSPGNRAKVRKTCVLAALEAANSVLSGNC